MKKRSRTPPGRKLIAVTLGALVAAGCSTMSTIRTVPPGATLYLNDRNIGTAPVEVELDDGFLPSATYSVEAKLPGYQAVKKQLKQEWNYVTIALEGVLIGGLIGLALCAVNCKSHLEDYSIELAPEAGEGSSSGAVSDAPRGPPAQNALGTPPTPVSGRAKVAVLPTLVDPAIAEELPELLDDYVVAAVQGAGDFATIGQQDLNTLLELDKNRQLVDCSSDACMADVGEALGVQYLVVIRIAKVASDWVITEKLMNVRETRVDSRRSEIVAGSAKDLLVAIPRVVGALFRAP